MKKGLTMLVAAMVIFGLICVIGSAAAATEAAIGTADVATAMIIFGTMVMAGVVALYIAMRHKKGHTITRPGRLAKALNTQVLLSLAVLDAKYTRMIHTTGVATSPKVIGTRICRTDFDAR